MPPMKLDEVPKLLEMMNAYGLDELVVTDGGFTLEARKHAVPAHRQAVHEGPVALSVPVAIPPQGIVPAAPPVVDPAWVEVKAPLVGTFYRRPSPDAAPFVEVGEKVEAGDVLCIVEAMKTMNEIQADVSGIVKEVGPGNGELVQFDQVLFRIEARA
jgi:acetyl-CoA carboxylase biotin carboxyl carrier protein